MVSCIHGNTKTIETVDFTTNCPKRRAGKACKYCYVERARNKGFNAKKVYENLPYKGEVKRYKEDRVKMLNEAGGTRLFSFGDYLPENDGDIKAFLDDCLARGLKVKAITKVADFVIKFHDHPALVVINVSIDSIGDGMDWVLAKTLKAAYKKVRVRTVILNDSDLPLFENWVDVFTFNHANGFKSIGWKKYSKEEVKVFAEKYPGRVCCETGKCLTCKIKCGQ